MNKAWIILFVSFFLESNITPFKFKDGPSHYTAPDSSKRSISRENESAPNILYYFSPPKAESYPIVLFCTGSSQKENLYSVVHIHRYFLEEVLHLNAALITVEQWGISDREIDAEAFMSHYTRKRRIHDHELVIHHLKMHPPGGWNGKLIFIGVSEGGPIVDTLTVNHQDSTIATINWCAASDLSWKDELWNFIGHLRENLWSLYFYDLLPKFIKGFIADIPYTKKEYEEVIHKIKENINSQELFMGMTYMYHADAFNLPPVNSKDIATPYLAVTGTLDPICEASDRFMESLMTFNENATYIRVEGMDHYIKNHPDILEQSFSWLETILAE